MAREYREVTAGERPYAICPKVFLTGEAKMIRDLQNQANVKRPTLERLDSFVAATAGRRITYKELTA